MCKGLSYLFAVNAATVQYTCQIPVPVLWQASRIRCGRERPSLLIATVQGGLKYRTEIYWPRHEVVNVTGRNIPVGHPHAQQYGVYSRYYTHTQNQGARKETAGSYWPGTRPAYPADHQCDKEERHRSAPVPYYCASQCQCSQASSPSVFCLGRDGPHILRPCPRRKPNL